MKFSQLFSAVPNPGNAVSGWRNKDLNKLSSHEVKPHEERIDTPDIDFIHDCRVLLRHRNAGLKGWIPLIVTAIVVVFVWWASWAELDEVTRGMGKVIPSQSVQVIQSLEGGIIEAIHVEEGAAVEKGQEILLIRDAIFSSSYQENLTKSDVLKARLARLDAEMKGTEAISFLPDTRPELAAFECSLFDSRRLDYQTTKESLERRLTIAQRQEQLFQDVRQSKAVSQVEMLQTQKEVAELDGDLAKLKTAFRRQASEQYDHDRADLEALVHALKRDKDRLDRTIIRSPVRGTVNKIYINTVGRVVGSGENIMEIVPSDDTLVVEAKVRPSDIAFIHPGQDATVKFTAYDFAIYGGLSGKVEKIGVDTIEDKDESGRPERFYQIRVRTQKTSLGKGRTGDELRIIPGMVAEVDVLTGHKTVLTYLLKPINRARERALRER
ncbi:HlyD family type I secretion periplasmic adaptor subunit [soil metagenome]